MWIISKMENYLEVKNPYEYENYLKILYEYQMKSFKRKTKALKYLVKKIFNIKLDERIKNIIGTESNAYRRLDFKKWCGRLKQYDVVSFDVFDTLILRSVLKSSDVFYLVGIKLQITGFKEIRELAEKEARNRKGLTDSDDVRIKDIYAIIHEWCNVDINTGIDAELEVETSICSANPYWYEVVKELGKTNTKIIATTDMYMSKEYIRKILKDTGYTGIEEIYVSCDVGASKRNGEIFDIIKKRYGREKKYIHIGDNKLTDFKMAKEKKWNAIYYKNVHDIGKRYRNISKSIISASVAGGIIDAELHNGKIRYTPREEFGFNYYGRLYIGYCQWLDKIAKEKDIDKFLFVSRDGYLLRKIYNEFFNTVTNKYIYTSRYALGQINVLEDMDLFMQQNFEPRAAKGTYTIRQLLEEVGLQSLTDTLESYGIGKNEIINRKNYYNIKKIMYKCKSQVYDVYKDSCIAAEKYFSELLENCKSVCIVDVGWYGTCTRGIYNFIKKHLKWEGKVCGAQIGIECGRQNIDMYAQGTLNAYIFSPDFNRGIYRQHDFGIGNVIDEIVFSAPEPSLFKYKLDEHENVTFEFMDEPVNNIEMVKEVQFGVYEYVKRYCGIQKKLNMQIIIYADTAYEPIIHIQKNTKYIKKLFGEYLVQRNAFTENKDLMKVKDTR